MKQIWIELVDKTTNQRVPLTEVDMELLIEAYNFVKGNGNHQAEFLSDKLSVLVSDSQIG